MYDARPPKALSKRLSRNGVRIVNSNRPAREPTMSPHHFFYAAAHGELVHYKYLLHAVLAVSFRRSIFLIFLLSVFVKYQKRV